jgi:membrane protease YdiL (CAAX protease family)
VTRQRVRAILQVNVFLTTWALLQLAFALPLLFAQLRQLLEDSFSSAVSPNGSTGIHLNGAGLDLVAAATVSGSLPGFGLAAGSLLAAVLAVLAMRRWAAGPSLGDLGLRLGAGWLGDLTFGLALGPMLFLVILLLELAVGWVRVEPGSIGPAGFGLALLTFVCVGAAEEVLIRGYTLQVLERAWGTGGAVGASAAIFALLHIANPDAGLTAVVGLAAAGLLFAYAYLTTRALWLPIGLHVSWNLSEGPIFGFPVSGLAGAGLLRTRVDGPELVTGGSFGPEAGLAGLLVVGLSFLAIGAWHRRCARRSAVAGMLEP